MGNALDLPPRIDSHHASSSGASQRASFQEAPPPIYPYAVDTGSFDPKNEEHARGASLAFGHWFDSSPPAPSPGLAGPPRFDLGDRAIDTTHIEDLFVFNSEGIDAAVHVRYEGSPAIALVSAPDRLQPSRDGFDPQAAIRLAFSPQTKGHHEGVIVISAEWQAGAHSSEQLRIPISAAAHLAGQPDLAAEEAEQREREQGERAAARDRAEMDHAKAAREDRLRRGQTSGNAATREALHDASEDAATAMTTLLATRKDGVNAAHEEAKLYHHHSPPYHESLLHALAMAALEVATAGIAGALAKKLEAALLEKLVTPATTVWSTGAEIPAHVSDPSKAVAAFFTDGLKDVVKKAGKAATPHDVHPETGEHAERGPQLSSDPMISFFLRESLAVGEQHGDAARAMSARARNVLEPLLDTAPESAIAAMRATAQQIDALASSEGSASTQLRESALHWMRYVASTSMGSVDSAAARTDGKRVTMDGSAPTNIAAANDAATVHGTPHRHAGLVDIEVELDAAHPEREVTAKKVHVDGISNAVSAHLLTQPLLAAGVAVRAYGIPNGHDAVVPLEAIRDEVGNVEYRDETGAPGMPGHWFARKAGEPLGGHDAAARGARMLLEEAAADFGRQVAAQSGHSNDLLETDSDDHPA